ncbi:DUF2336 domain-containing protein [Phenylobacterium sp.]|uniref:DUF2336 domain-containing protein n=1 Tax=Phenylobacterium sp. TaxID=1871053 RepID=UPI0035B080AE
MGVAIKTEQILGLAKSRSPQDRERLLLAVVDLANSSEGEESMAAPAVQALLNSIFMSLVVEAERDIRRRLAEKLAAAAWAPPALINVLALDDLEIAAPIIAQSPVLKDHDLVRLLVEATVEHQIEVARRPSLGPPVVAAILSAAEPAVLTALADNTHTELSPFDMEQLLEASRHVTGLRAPLSRRPELTSGMAQRLYVWVGQSLRQALVGRFRLDAQALDAELAHAVHAAHGAVTSEGDDELPMTVNEEREGMERRLISKLHAAGQLRPAYLLRALREHRISLFEAALAALGGFDFEEVRRAIDSDRPELLALACAAVGIDKSCFPDMLDLVRQLNGGRPSGGAEGARRAVGAFGPFSPEVASAAFRQAVSSV